MNDEDDLPTKIMALHNAGQPLRRIAFVTRLSLEEAEREMLKLGLKPRLRSKRVERKPRQAQAQARPQSGPPPKNPRKSEIIAAPNWKINPSKYALEIFKGRAKDTPQGFTFDGLPIGYFDLIRRANRVLKEAGAQQMDACWEWVIRD